jgi:hypothetical protein
MVRSSFPTRPEYFLRVAGKVFGIFFQTLEDAEEMAGVFIARGVVKVVIVRNGSGLIVKRFGNPPITRYGRRRPQNDTQNCP